MMPALAMPGVLTIEVGSSGETIAPRRQALEPRSSIQPACLSGWLRNHDRRWGVIGLTAGSASAGWPVGARLISVGSWPALSAEQDRTRSGSSCTPCAIANCSSEPWLKELTAGPRIQHGHRLQHSPVQPPGAGIHSPQHRGLPGYFAHRPFRPLKPAPPAARLGQLGRGSRPGPPAALLASTASLQRRLQITRRIEAPHHCQQVERRRQAAGQLFGCRPRARRSVYIAAAGSANIRPLRTSRWCC